MYAACVNNNMLCLILYRFSKRLLTTSSKNHVFNGGPSQHFYCRRPSCLPSSNVSNESISHHAGQAHSYFSLRTIRRSCYSASDDGTSHRPRNISKIDTKEWLQSLSSHSVKKNNWRNYIRQVLECNERELQDIMAVNSKMFQMIKPVVVSNMLQFLKDEGLHVPGKFLQKNVWLLSFYPIEEKFKILKSLFSTMRIDYLPLLKTSKSHLIHAGKVWKSDSAVLADYDTRLEYIAEVLNWPVHKVCTTAADRHSPLLTLPLEKITSVFNLLVENNVDPESIGRDLWIIRHNLTVMKERIEICNNMNVPVRVWLLRSTKEIFQNSINRTSSNKRVLDGHKDTIDYLANRLQCSRDTVIDIGDKNPSILKINPMKLEESLDVLFNFGITPERILHLPRVLTLSIATCQMRFNVLTQLKYEDINKNLWILTLNQKDFENFLLRLKWRRKKKKSAKPADAVAAATKKDHQASTSSI